MNVVFDFGAVLFTWRPLDLVADCFPDRAGTPALAGHLAHAVFGHADWHAFDRGTVTMPEVIDRTVARLGLERSALCTLVETIGDRLLPMPDSVALLKGLATRRQERGDVRLYYLSNMPEPYARVLEARHDFLTLFDGGIFSGDVKHIKPEPAIYQLLQSRYALAPERTVFIDDLKTNIVAAQALGWHGIHFESAGQVQAGLAALGV